MIIKLIIGAIAGGTIGFLVSLFSRKVLGEGFT